jgi:hypothetical protein
MLELKVAMVVAIDYRLASLQPPEKNKRYHALY